MAKPVGLLLSVLALAICLPVPALADTNADQSAEDNKAQDIARKLDDPMTQLMVAGALAAVTKQMLDARVEPFVRAMEKAGAGAAVPDVPPDATVGDLAGPEAAQMPRQIMKRVPKLMDSLADLASAYGDMLPELEAMAKRIKEAAPQH